MSDTIIRVENLAKRYPVYNQNRRSNHGLRHVLENAAVAPWTALQKLRAKLTAGNTQPQHFADAQEEFWALRDISFEIKRGEVLGIIGCNGSGKSTLLKILSRITEPTHGRVGINGKVASLLEVGTGFHPELTGRENIYLNGTILGMNRAEVGRKFDEIVSFSGVEKFLDTPVKFYSSGMYVRLAFAVAAHLEPDILIVDEVLAVGDIEFQKKCLNSMQSVASGGRTVLFVSHQLNSVRAICQNIMLLDAGRMVMLSSDVDQVIQHYHEQVGVDRSVGIWENKWNLFNDLLFQPVKFFLSAQESDTPVSTTSNDRPLWFHLEAIVKERDPALCVGFAIYDSSNQLLFWSFNTDIAEDQWPSGEPGHWYYRACLPTRMLNEGEYRLELIASLHNRWWIISPETNNPAIYFQIRGGLSESPYWRERRPGCLAPVISWEVEPLH